MHQTLAQKITGFVDLGNDLPEVPAEIRNNLKPFFELRPYQEEAFGRFIYYLSNNKLRQKPSSLLFHMATGSGKTLIMAGTILYLYRLGYRNFLFFVNSTNIIQKTRENFLNPLSSKYLFSESIAFGDKKIRIKEADNFQAADKDDITVVFSTIQGLHSRLTNPSENSITYDDFDGQKIVLISDEAHHINAETKRGALSKEEREELVSWERTVSRIFGASPENILLEFTATIDFSNPDIESKYSNKILFDYPLKQFRIDKYSKEVQLLQSDNEPIQRALLAVILSQYRRKVFEKYKKHIKPVIMFKSKTIAESKEFYCAFLEKIKGLRKSDITGLSNSAEPVIKRCFDYFTANGIKTENLIEELKNDFSDNKCIEINSNEESEAKQIAINTLEDKSNEFRAVFAVNKLNEGWDVLNLFDIVRLYNTRDAMQGKPGNTTIAEAQLIGRGARYCPFQIKPTDLKYQRKYDSGIDNELRICEELYYHSASNPKYIQEIKTALQEIGMLAKETREIPLQLKLDFKETEFYKSGLIFLNEQKKYNREDIVSLPSTITEHTFPVDINTGAVIVTGGFDNKPKTGMINTKSRDVLLNDLGYSVVRKAMARLEFYQFNNLKSFLPNLSSMTEFIESDKYLAKVKCELTGQADKLDNLLPDDKLRIVSRILIELSEKLQSEKIEFKGTEEFKACGVAGVFKDKVLNVFVREGGDQEYGIAQSQTTNKALRVDLSNKSWYVYNDNFGTSEEKYLIKFIDKTYDALKKKWDEVFLVRNEKHFQLYNFDDGKPLEPDFVLFLKKSEPDESLYYQVFIEPKGEHLLKTDEWKENFLKALKKRHKITTLWKTKKYVIWGMPFYNEALRKTEFENDFNVMMK